MEFTKDLIDKLADNLLIGLTEDENKMVLEEFKYIEENMDLINEIPNINKIDPMTHPFPVIVDLNDDEYLNELKIEDILENCKDMDGREVKIPKVVGE